MAKTRTAEFTASDDWTCPAGVSAVWLTMIGGGSGACTSKLCTGGNGSGEFVMGRLVPVVPGDVYSVVVGTKGLGGVGADNTRPTPPTASSFGGFNALGGGIVVATAGAPSAPQNSGDGGGVGGGDGLDAGGGSGPYAGQREGGRYFGGAAGGGGTPYANPVNGELSHIAGVRQTGTGTGHGGTLSLQGIWVGGDNFFGGGGGGGGGSVWGATNGKDGHEWTADADPTHYGCGAGGGGSSEDGTTVHTGGDGAPGYVLLMWVA